MKALVLGAGGREHALVYALKKSSFVDEVIAAPETVAYQKWWRSFR